MARLAPLSDSAYLSSWNSMKPLRSSSIELKRASIADLGASYPSAAIDMRNSTLSTAPLPSSSHSRKRSISLTACLLRISRSCSCTLVPERAVSLTIDGSAAVRAAT